ncbi:MAG: transposase, partial [Desulfovibrionaceae bacterium]|nr:transposase [Desulfovibrionaceae bacterium]
GRRSSIEPVIGHVKNDFRLRRNYLKGEIGDSINFLLACAAFNLKKWMNLRAKETKRRKSKLKNQILKTYFAKTRIEYCFY